MAQSYHARRTSQPAAPNLDVIVPDIAGMPSGAYLGGPAAVRGFSRKARRG